MWPRAPRMQVRYFGWLLVVVAFVAIVFCLHLLAEISRLDDARLKLAPYLLSVVRSGPEKKWTEVDGDSKTSAARVRRPSPAGAG
ncbi:hypothetical protein BaRGS_00006102 [Batillaria attramentaria]|uniref:Uncharacterized protein n=1 Tax=Batillaria attramentaria TaxID=370345 RepID=A0ABD0LU96_9CAEN